MVGQQEHTKVKVDFINLGQLENPRRLKQTKWFVWKLFDAGLLLCRCKWLGSSTYPEEDKVLKLYAPYLFFGVFCLSEINIWVLQGSE